MSSMSRGIVTMVVSMALATLSWEIAEAGPGHSGPHGGGGREMLENMREMHQAHKHGHDFKAMDEMLPEQGERLIKLMREVGLALEQRDLDAPTRQQEGERRTPGPGSHDDGVPHPASLVPRGARWQPGSAGLASRHAWQPRPQGPGSFPGVGASVSRSIT